jgi:pimeloyl-ACP methyl ester carboxylesterase
VRFVLLKAKHRSGHVIYVNLGGPGEELSEVPDLADGAFFKQLGQLRDRYDILFVDERGFGTSNPLPCELSPPRDPAIYFAKLWPQRLLKACRQKDAAKADLAQYNTPAAIHDLDDLRAALGYKKLVFDVASYGTFTALLYMRTYPQNVESAVLQGVAPPGIMNQGREFARGAQHSLERLVAECNADSSCRKRFPHFREHFYALLARLDRNPVPVQLRNMVTKRIQTVGLSREVFNDNIRHLLYSPDSAAIVPLMVEEAYHGNTLLLGNAVQVVTQGFAQGITGGAFLSYTCAEVMPFTDKAADIAYARTTWYGDDRDRAQRAACATWNVPPFPANFARPVRSDAPVLMINGTDDPATPPVEAQTELRYLSHGALMLVRGAPHDAESPCIDKAIERFIRADSAAGLKLDACSASFKRPPFALKPPPILR